MTADDVALVVEIERAAFSTPWNAGTFGRLLDRPDTEMPVLEHPRHGVIGYAVLWCVREQGELANIAIAEKWRGRGFGSLLLERVLDRARQRGIRSLFLEVRVSNERATRMYETRGFQEIGRRRNYYERPREDARVLMKRIGGRSDEGPT